MELIDQHTKAIMEECKVRARDAGLQFDRESLEYIVTNRDLIELSPKVMIPTLYDYWVHDVEILKGEGIYKLYPSNPYETVINSRPAVSFYNDNNPDWLNIMIFYHVLGHIDFFQNNILFERTWTDDFVGQALADKRQIASLRSVHGRWVDYVIEFSRSIDNLVGYFKRLSALQFPPSMELPEKVEYYFDDFLQKNEKMPEHEIYREIERYNDLLSANPETGESIFFSEVQKRYPELPAKFKAFKEKREPQPVSVMDFIHDHSPFLKKEKNAWMKSVMTIVKNTALYFEPQIRTKILNEGWASYWHDELFTIDERIRGHEVSYAKSNAEVTAVNRVGLNPYAIGLRLVRYVQDLGDRGKLSVKFQRIENMEERANYDAKLGRGKERILNLRRVFSDHILINLFVDQDFVDMNDLFVVGIRHNPQRDTDEYYIKSRNAEDYKQMLLDSLYHPPKIDVIGDKTDESNLYLRHAFEGKPLHRDYIADTMIGVEYLWGGPVRLETTEVIAAKPEAGRETPKVEKRRVIYTAKDRKVDKRYL